MLRTKFPLKRDPLSSKDPMSEKMNADNVSTLQKYG